MPTFVSQAFFFGQKTIGGIGPLHQNTASGLIKSPAELAVGVWQQQKMQIQKNDESF